MNQNIKIVMTTTSEKHIAEALARDLVKKRFSPCVQIIDNMTSIYEWEGEIENTSEVLVIIKTTSEKLKQVNQLILEKHNYDVPEIIQIDSVIANQKYLDWFNNFYKQDN
ncbi:MAG: divalent-cation tolerance protein CutA [Candidatus Marinimicrobia bacterium]|nr:divalent-cation tolerance protein CutA [Candidatus Neomarinimicrobiota bacterium]